MRVPRLTRGAVAVRGLASVLVGLVLSVACAWGLALAASSVSQRLVFIAAADASVPHGPRVAAGPAPFLPAFPADAFARLHEADNGGFTVVEASPVDPRPWGGRPVRGEALVPVLAGERDAAVRAEIPGWLRRRPAVLLKTEHLAQGWPVRSFYAVDPGSAAASPGVWRPSWINRPRNARWHTGAIALLPMWEGILANTLLFAAPLLAVTLGLPWLAGAARVHAGRCRRCGYDLAGSADAGCPECGEGRG